MARAKSASARLALSTVTLAILAGSLATGALAAKLPDQISLAGAWRFQLDRANAGVEEKWFSRALPDRVTLPGSLPAQGIGDDVSVDTKWMGDIVDRSWFTDERYAPYRQPGNVKVPFWLQPDKYYAGVAWYQREVEIPADWQGRRVVLTLERPHWETRVWLDGKAIGSNNSLSTAHEYDLGAGLPPGRHQLTVRVDNGLVVDIGVNSHSITDHTQGNWNGIVGDISLRATDPVWVEDLQVFPHIATKSATIKGRIGNLTGVEGRGTLVININPFNLNRAKESVSTRLEVSWTAAGGLFQTDVTLDPRAGAWDEFATGRNVEIQRVRTWLEGPGLKGTKGVHFGMREVATDGAQLLLNGRKIFIRGTLECCIFPRTGHPPTDVESWKRIIRVCQAHGLNLIRFHSWCPPEAAFVAADELGFYYHVEVASWPNQSTTLGDGKPVDQWIYAETDRILKAYGNHPSLLLLACGNEPGGRNHAAYLAKWVSHYRAQDPRRLYTAGAGWPQIAENQFHVTPDPRIQGWGAGLKSRINARPPETCTDYRDYIQQRQVPVISHEIGQWCVYPNFDEISKYTGYLKAKNFEIFRASLAANHMSDLARQFLLASGKLQTLCYKEDIESALRTPGMGGFELLDLHDFPGQGTALVGVLDPFWESKGYVAPEVYHRFCNPTVPLARLPKRVFTTTDTLQADLELAHFGDAPWSNAVPSWKLVDRRGKAVASGKLPPRDVPIGNGIALGKVSINLKNVPAPAQYKLVVSVSPSAGPARDAGENDWDVWVYPSGIDTASADVLVAEDLTGEALEKLRGGGRVLLQLPVARVKGDALGRKVALGFSSIFWNTAWTRGQAPHTLGILCDPAHPALAEFPTDFHSNWQWWYLVHDAAPMVLDGLPSELQPVVRVIDDWVTNRRLALAFEAKVGAGKLLVCSAAAGRETEADPVTRQFRHSLLRYMAGARFRPAVALTPEQVRSLISEPGK